MRTFGLGAMVNIFSSAQPMVLRPRYDNERAYLQGSLGLGFWFHSPIYPFACLHSHLRFILPDDARGGKTSMTTLAIDPSLDSNFPNFFLRFVSALWGGVNRVQDWMHAELSEKQALRD
jgi:hypothetical protein